MLLTEFHLETLISCLLGKFIYIIEGRDCVADPSYIDGAVFTIFIDFLMNCIIIFICYVPATTM